MNFEMALSALKAGHRIAREGWNGKDMWLVLLKFERFSAYRSGTIMFEHDCPKGVCFKLTYCIGMKTATGEMQPGWLVGFAGRYVDK